MLNSALTAAYAAAQAATQAPPPPPVTPPAPPTDGLPDAIATGPISIQPGPAAPAPIPSSPLVDAFRASLPAGATDGHLYLWDQMAGGGAMDTGGLDRMTDLAAQGLHFGDVLHGRTQENLRAAADDLTDRTSHLDDGQFQALLSQLNDLAAHPPAPQGRPALVAPNLAQLGVAGLAGLLVPRLALQAAAAPFQAQLQRNQWEEQNVQAQNAAAQRTYDGRVQGLKGELDAVQRHDAVLDNIDAREQGRRENIASRQFVASQQEKARLLGDLHDAGDNPAKLQAALSALDAGGYGKYVPDSVRTTLLGAAHQSAADKAKETQRSKDEVEAQRYLALANDPNALPSARALNARMAQSLIARNDADDPRVSAIENALPTLGQMGQKQIDDHGRTVATTANLDARTQTENDTRQGRIQALLDAHDLAGVRKAAVQAQTELAQTRQRWIAPEQRAHIAEMEAQASRARRSADDAAAGMSQRPPKSPLPLQRADVSFGNAIDRTQKELDSLRAQQTTLQAFAGAGSLIGGDGHAADLDRLNALIVARSADLQRLQRYRADNATRLAAYSSAMPAGASVQPTPNGPSPLAGPLGVGDARQTKSGVKYRVVK